MITCGAGPILKGLMAPIVLLLLIFLGVCPTGWYKLMGVTATQSSDVVSYTTNTYWNCMIKSTFPPETPTYSGSYSVIV